MLVLFLAPYSSSLKPWIREILHKNGVSLDQLKIRELYIKFWICRLLGPIANSP